MKRDGFTLVELLIVVSIVGILLIGFPLLGLWTDRNLDFWMSHFKGTAVNVPYWLSLVVTIIGNAVILAANVLGEICRFMV